MSVSLRRNATLGAAALVALLAFGTTASATVDKCVAGKVKCVNKKVSALLTCHVHAATAPEKGGPVLTDCVDKARAKFDGGTKGVAGSCFGKVETRFPGGCLTTGDLAAVEAKVDAYVGDVENELNPGSGPPIVNPCQSKKVNCVRSETAALFKCHQKLDPVADVQALADCVDKARAKFDGGTKGVARSCFGKLETKYSGACLTTGDLVALGSGVDAHVNDVVCELGGPCLCGNGVTDPGEVCDPGDSFNECPSGDCNSDCTCGPLLCCTVGCMAVSRFDPSGSGCVQAGFGVVPCSTCAGLRGDCCVLSSMSFCVELGATECASMGGTARPCADCACCTDGDTCGQASVFGCPGDTTSIGCGVCWQ